MKVLMIGPARNVNGGISAVVNNLYKAGLDRKVEIQYIGTMEDGSKWHKLKVVIGALIRFIREVPKFDIVHINMASDSSLYRKLPFMWLTKTFGKKLVIHQHGGNFKEFYYSECSEHRRNFIKSFLDKADAFIVVAPYLKDIFKEIIDEEKITVITNAIEIPKEPAHDFTSQKLVFLGRLCVEKGIDELLDAVTELKPQFPNLELYLAGVWVDEKLQEKANQCGENVHQLGWIDAIQRDQLLRECNIFVLPTYFEGMPMSLLEGMAYGCACVASKVGGIPQVVESGKDGMMIPAKDTKALVETLEELLLNPEKQKQLGEAARKKAVEQYNVSNKVNELLEIYQKL